MESNLPDYVFLEAPFKIEGTPLEQKKSFFALARSRVKLASAKEHKQFEKALNAHLDVDLNSPARACLGFNRHSTLTITNTENGVESDNVYQDRVSTAYISIDVSFFTPDGEDFFDLLPVIIEHEVYEMWLTVKRGFRPNAELKHPLARRHEFAKAAEWGSGERLLIFCAKYRLHLLEEFEYALNAWKKRHPLDPRAHIHPV
ncbi:MAG: hypothetical protein Q7S32_01845 [bacterium]|nr:hypothetical protein [bacterium]